MKKVIYLFLLFIAGCGIHPFSKSNIIRIKGSDTMLLISNHWAENFMKKHPDISVYSEGGGTATGAQALAEGRINICAASRPLRPEEIQLLAKNFRRVGVSTLVAKDALTIYLHPDNPIKNLSMQQLSEIFKGKIKNWKDIGGNDASITILNRMPSSGSYVYFQEHVLNGSPYSLNTNMYPTTRSILQAISENINAIGYGGIGYEKKFHIAIDGIKPTRENVINDQYPITRYLYFYTLDTPKGSIKKFIDWVLGKEGQNIVNEEGYFPIWDVH